MSFFFSPRKFSRRPSATTKISVHLVLILVVARKFLVHFSFSPLVTVHFFTTRLPRKKKTCYSPRKKSTLFHTRSDWCVCVCDPSHWPSLAASEEEVLTTTAMLCRVSGPQGLAPIDNLDGWSLILFSWDPTLRRARSTLTASPLAHFISHSAQLSDSRSVCRQS